MLTAKPRSSASKCLDTRSDTITGPQAPVASPTSTPYESRSCQRFCDRPMPRKPAAMRTTPERTAPRAPKSSASFPNSTAPTAHPIMETVYGMVATARDQPNSISIGGRNRLNVLNPIDVRVTTATLTSRIPLRDRRMGYRRRISGAAIALDVMLQLFDGELLFGNDVLHQIAD